MATELTRQLFTKMLESALSAVEANFDYLNKLDSATGDGDHGTAILATMRAAVEATSSQEDDFSSLLTNIGMGIMSATGGSTSSLTGSFYLGMGDFVKKESLSPAETAEMFAAGLTEVETMTKARVGDKTLMDALIPAIDAMKTTKSGSLSDLFQVAAEAAVKGSESTKDLVAKFGRAHNLGDRSIGHYDAGAVSQSLIFKAFAETVAEN